MSVIFDVFFYTPQYREQLRMVEKKRFPKEDVDIELGGICCRNAQRESGIQFYNVDELIELLVAGYRVAEATKVMETDKPMFRPEEYPEGATNHAKVELNSLYRGCFYWGEDPKGQTFGTKDELKLILS